MQADLQSDGIKAMERKYGLASYDFVMSCGDGTCSDVWVRYFIEKAMKAGNEEDLKYLTQFSYVKSRNDQVQLDNE